jgi:hypothetical protein
MDGIGSPTGPWTTMRARSLVPNYKGFIPTGKCQAR